MSWGDSSGDLLEKLGILKIDLTRWANQIQQNRKLKKEILTAKLATLLEADRDDENLAEIIDTKIHLNMEIDKDEIYWEQKARINWLKLGDKNTSFFHKQASQRKKRNLIQKLQFDDGREAIENEEIKEIARSYFVKLFSVESHPSTDRIFSGIETCVSEEDNINLKARFTEKEIWTALTEMGPIKAPGEDGLPAIFYKKMLANHWEGLKLDMSKAYDRVDWNFIKKVMMKMGFEKGWVDMVFKCVSSISYSVIVNGTTSESFLSLRGLRQGDPLSLFLFLFCGEGLSSLMRLAKANNTIKGVKASRSGLAISHLLFADDCILFVEATKKCATSLKQILLEYEMNSGQCVNFDKSTIFLSKNTQERERRTISQVLNVRTSNDIERYLGLPSMVGRRKRSSFQNLKDRFKQKIDNWSIRSLSQGGKEVFIKAVLQAIPTFSMTCFLLPKTLCKDLEGILAKFWWKKSQNRKGIHWCAWKDLCLLKENGGIGFQNLADFNVALLAKQGWRLINYPDSLLARTLKAKYYPNSNFSEARLGNLHSLTWRSVWAARGLLDKGLCWRVGMGEKISIWDDLWISGKEEDRIPNQDNNANIKLVSDLIDATSRRWKPELIRDTFAGDIVEKILQIPLAELAHEDLQVWRGELTEEFSVRSAYKLLQYSSQDPNDALCPRCRLAEEDGRHLFQQCPATIEIWNQLNLSWVQIHNNLSMWDRLTWIFKKGCNEQIRLFCCGLWFIWFSRNSLLYERKLLTGAEIVRKITSYVSELEALRVGNGLPRILESSFQIHSRGRVMIQFDAAFDGQVHKSATGLLVRDEEGVILASKAIIHHNIASPFTAEAYAGLQVAKLGIMMSLNRVLIMGDSKTVIKKCQSKNIDKSIIRAIIRDIHNHLSTYQEIEFTFIPKLENRFAHTIAKEALKIEESYYLLGGLHNRVRQAVHLSQLKKEQSEEKRSKVGAGGITSLNKEYEKMKLEMGKAEIGSFKAAGYQPYWKPETS
ncbi:reverse transcriptase [Gossypium australe]|uniref:Reverse transcriptase n=1 Tax=Gossypium australe TaxID=47621 RepID=A0A5B6UWP0_9ROSI|nr:reverse transcriptase [Gossypium australe]